MTTYHYAQIGGLLFHWIQKYGKADTWNILHWAKDDLKYVRNSVILTALMAFFGPNLISFVTGDGFTVTPELKASLATMPGVVGFLLGATGGSFIYNLPMIGQQIKDTLMGKPDK